MIVGLWPFNFQANNRVGWLQNGLHFERQSQVYTEAPWKANSESGSFTIELRLRSGRVCDCLGTILSWYAPSQGKALKIEQSISDLVVRGNFADQQHHPAFRSLWLDDTLRDNQTRFLTIAAGPDGTVLYLEGAKAREYRYTPAGENLSGRLVLGHSTRDRNAWEGDLLGLALYNRALSAPEVSRNYQIWREGRVDDLKATKDIAGLYLFDEGRGDVVHNRMGSLPDLNIPAKFSVLTKIPLIPSAKLHWSDLKDAAINIGGFAPFGFLVSAYLRWGRHSSKKNATRLAVLFGAATSLLIELLQVYLPSRDSSYLDVINNIMGSALGAALLVWVTSRWQNVVLAKAD